MNKTLEEYARSQLKYKLSCCGREQQKNFKRMYSLKGDISVSINAVIDSMDVDKLDWALSQVESTLGKKDVE